MCSDNHWVIFSAFGSEDREYERERHESKERDSVHGRFAKLEREWKEAAATLVAQLDVLARYTIQGVVTWVNVHHTSSYVWFVFLSIEDSKVEEHEGNWIDQQDSVPLDQGMAGTGHGLVAVVHPTFQVRVMAAGYYDVVQLNGRSRSRSAVFSCFICARFYFSESASSKDDEFLRRKLQDWEGPWQKAKADLIRVFDYLKT